MLRFTSLFNASFQRFPKMCSQTVKTENLLSAAISKSVGGVSSIVIFRCRINVQSMFEAFELSTVMDEQYWRCPAA